MKKAKTEFYWAEPSCSVIVKEPGDCVNWLPFIGEGKKVHGPYRTPSAVTTAVARHLRKKQKQVLKDLSDYKKRNAKPKKVRKTPYRPKAVEVEDFPPIADE